MHYLEVAAVSLDGIHCAGAIVASTIIGRPKQCRADERQAGGEGPAVLPRKRKRMQHLESAAIGLNGKHGAIIEST